MPASWPRDLEMKAEIPSMFNNDGGDQVMPIGRCRNAGIVNSVEFVPSWNLTGANTNSRTLVLINRRTTGTGTTTMCSLPLTSGLSLTRGVAVSLVISAANAPVVVGDILEWNTIHVGNGMQDPGGEVIIQQSLGN